MTWKNKTQYNLLSENISRKLILALLLLRSYLTTQDVLIIKGPAINLDKKKFFKEPKIIKRIYLNDKKDYEDSLIKSCNFFLKTAISNSFFKKDIFNYSLQSNRLIF